MAHNEQSKRAATILTIAQLKFKQALKKEDNENRLPPVSIELSASFLNDIDAVLKKNTPANVQKCTGWIVKHIAPSKTRIASLGDYLVSVSKSVIVEQTAEVPDVAVMAVTRGRFATLLIVSDILHTDKFHQRKGPTVKPGVFSKEFMPHLYELVELAATYLSKKDSQMEKQLRALLNFWFINDLVSAADFRALRDRAEEAILIAQGGTPVRKRHYLLPEYHGDRNAEWSDLPASYMLESMIKHPDRPIDIRHVRAIKFDKKPVSPFVRGLLDSFFENIDLKYVPTGDNPTGETKKYKLSLDPIGQLVKSNKETGETTTACNGYGWSMKFCQDMQKDGLPEVVREAREMAQQEEEMEMVKPSPQQRRGRRHHSPASRRWASPSSGSEYERGRGRRSRSRDRHSSISSYDSRYRDRDRSRSGSGLRKSSKSRGRRHGRSRSRSRSYDSYYGSRSREHSRPNRRNDHHERKYEREHDQPHLNKENQWNRPGNPNRNPQHGQYPPQPPFSAPPFMPQAPPPHQFPGQLPFPPPPPPPFQPGAFPGGVPPPPPPAPDFSGPFPPVPMNMPGMQNAYNFSGNQFPGNAPGTNHGYSQNQGSYHGGRGGYRGNFQSGGNGNRGGFGGHHRGQRGGR